VSADTDRLKIMAKNAPSKAANIEASISSVENLVDELQKEKSAIQNGLCGTTKSELMEYLNGNKLTEIQNLYGTIVNEPFSVDYGPLFGAISYTNGGITDFSIIDVSGNIKYEYLGTNWDGDTAIAELINDYAFGNDYLTRPLTSGATYGINGQISSLNSAVNLLNENADKVADSQAIFLKYAT